MIPKIIHYCWFGISIMPSSQKRCIRMWKSILKDYQFIKWDEKNFDINYCNYSKEAYKNGKYAYVSDVARCKILYEHGGIYLDTDVEVYKNLDSFLNHSLFTGIEVYKEYFETMNKQPEVDKSMFVPFFGLLSSIIGSIPRNPLLNDCLNYYKSIQISNSVFKGFAIDGLLANQAVNYGFVYEDKYQELANNIIIYPTGVFGYADSINPDYSVAYHYNVGSWAPKTKHQKFYLFLDRYRLLQIYKKMRAVKNWILKR